MGMCSTNKGGGQCHGIVGLKLGGETMGIVLLQGLLFVTRLHCARFRFVLYLSFIFFAMPPRMHALSRSQVQKRTCASLRYFEASVTMVVRETDVDIRLLVNLKKFIEDCALWRGVVH